MYVGVLHFGDVFLELLSVASVLYMLLKNCAATYNELQNYKSDVKGGYMLNACMHIVCFAALSSVVNLKNVEYCRFFDGNAIYGCS